jgi:hypothetical protein
MIGIKKIKIEIANERIFTDIEFVNLSLDGKMLVFWLSSSNSSNNPITFE